ncbi:MAG: hypothetical protein U0931_33920 [Vulcanimicrobiota bacterium]
MRLNRRRGSLLFMVLAGVMVLITLISVMHYQQGIARQSVMRSEADLQFRQSRRYAKAQQLNKTFPSPPSSLEVLAPVTATSAKLVDVPDKYSTSLWDKLPDVVVTADLAAPNPGVAAPGTKDLQIKPTSSNFSLRVFAKNTYRLEKSSWFSYAAYAPKGSISAANVSGWANPRYDDTRTSISAYSGVPTVLAAKQNVSVNGTLAYGTIYSQSGTPSFKAGQAIAFKGFFPFPAYEGSINGALQSAFNDISTAAASSDKTQLITGGILATLSNLASGDFLDILTLQQAMTFRFFPIPGFTCDAVDVAYEFWFSMPYPADFSQSPKSNNGKDVGKEISDATTKYKNDKKALDELQAKYDAASKDDKDKMQSDLDKAKSKVQDDEKVLKDLKDKLQQNAQDSKKNINDNLSAADIPLTRADDKLLKDPNNGWAYKALIEVILDLLIDLLQGKTAAALDALAPQVRLVHYGRKTHDCGSTVGSSVSPADFTWDNNTFTSISTWTVPPGRTLTYSGNMNIQGGLWLQRGSAMKVTGNLNVQGSSVNPMSPKGRVFLEEGATLEVGGDFSCEGNKVVGSVLVASTPGQVHPVNTAILCQGNVYIPYGVYSGATIPEFLTWLDTKPGLAGIGKANEALTPLLTYLAPNLAKMSGPFHTRKCYFATYATTFQLFIIPILEVPIPTPIPLPHKNVWVPIFKGLTQLYSATLNFSLGENLYTQSDWWIFGNGVVPMVPKLGLDQATHVFSGLSLPSVSLPDPSKIGDFVKDHYKKVLEGVAKKLAEKVISQIMAQIATAVADQLGGGGVIVAALDILIGTLNDEIDKLIEDSMGQDDTLSGLGEDALEYLRDKLETEVSGLLDDAFLRENAGALIYAGQKLKVGYMSDGTAASLTPAMSAGMFIASGDIDMNVNYTCGTVLSLNGNIKMNNFLYNPYFSRASLYVPKSSESDWVQRGFEFLYGKSYDSGQARDIGPGIPAAITAEGWDR